jgi:hypothetical protein
MPLDEDEGKNGDEGKIRKMEERRKTKEKGKE